MASMHDILIAPDKKISLTFGGLGILSRLWRTILRDLGIGPVRFAELLQEHITNPINRVSHNRRDQISYRGNLTKEFAKPEMTLKVFMKVMRFLNIKSMDLEVHIRHSNLSVTHHLATANFTHKNSNNEFFKELDTKEIQFIDKDEILLKVDSLINEIFEQNKTITKQDVHDIVAKAIDMVTSDKEDYEYP